MKLIDYLKKNTLFATILSCSYILMIVLACEDQVRNFLAYVFGGNISQNFIWALFILTLLPGVSFGIKSLYKDTQEKSSIKNKYIQYTCFWVATLGLLGIILYLQSNIVILFFPKLFVFSLMLFLISSQFSFQDLINNTKRAYLAIPDNVSISTQYRLVVQFMQILQLILLIVLAVLVVDIFVGDIVINNIILLITLWAFAVVSMFRVFPEEISKLLKQFLVITIAIILSLTAFFVVYKANFRFSDETLFMNSLAIGQYLNSKFDLYQHRYHPMGFIHNNWLLLTNIKGVLTAKVLYIQNVLMMLLAFSCLFFALKKYTLLNKTNNVLILITLLFIIFIPRGFTQIFLDIVYLEPTLLFLLALFLLLMFWAHRKPTYVKYTFALIPYIVATYTKEPIFVIGLTIGLGNLILNYKQCSKYLKYFSTLLIFNAIVFVIFYFKATHNINDSANSYLITHTDGAGVFTTFKIILANTNYLYIFPILLSIFRCYRVVFKKERILFSIDLLLVSAFAYMLTYVYIGFDNTHYQIPALVIIYYCIGIYIQYYYYQYSNNKIIDLNVRSFIIFFFVFQTIISIQGIKQIISDNASVLYGRYNTMKFVTALVDLHKQGVNLVYIPNYASGWYEGILTSFLQYQDSEYKNPTILTYAPTVTPFSYKIAPYSMQSNDLLILSNSNDSPKKMLENSKITSTEQIYYLGTFQWYAIYSVKSFLPKAEYLIHKLHFNPIPIYLK